MHGHALLIEVWPQLFNEFIVEASLSPQTSRFIGFLGFQLDFPLGGISRREFERMFTTKNAKKMSDVVFR